MPKTESVRFKGTRQGVHLLIDPARGLDEVLVELDQRLKGSDQFFRSASVMLNVGGREISESQLSSLQDVLNKYGLSIITAHASDTDTRSVLRSRGIQVETPDESSGFFRMESAASDGERTGAGPAAGASSDALVVHKTLRSGQSISHEGDICLIGDVNPGAEIIAGDNVIVWGSIRGVVQAGMSGSETSVICALELAPTQLRIASLVTRQPEAVAEPAPEMARILDGQIVVEQWLSRSRRVRKLR